MAIRTSRILLVSAGLIAVASLWLWWNARERPAPVDPNDAPWIGLPKSGMDATQPHIREMILLAFDYGRNLPHPGPGSLAFDCGSNHQTFDGRERYIARISKDLATPAWKIVLDVHGDHIDIAWSEADSMSPPPPPPPGYREGGATLIVGTSHASKARSDLEKIRALWSGTTLWQAPQGDVFGCRDGYPVFLEACVNGQYAARYRNCDMQAYDATDKLWQAFTAILPPPPKPEWHNKVGNPISDSSSH